MRQYHTTPQSSSFFPLCLIDNCRHRRYPKGLPWWMFYLLYLDLLLKDPLQWSRYQFNILSFLRNKPSSIFYYCDWNSEIISFWSFESISRRIPDLHILAQSGFLYCPFDMLIWSPLLCLWNTGIEIWNHSSSFYQKCKMKRPIQYSF